MTPGVLARLRRTDDKDRAGNLDLSHLDADLINEFLAALETQRGNGIATRNARLAAVHSFLAYASRYHPEHLAAVGRVFTSHRNAGPETRSAPHRRRITALLTAPDQAARAGRRDHAMFQLASPPGYASPAHRTPGP